MSPGQTLRAFVTARLAAAAEDIFELFERTILEYEEELCRCKKKRRHEEDQDEERRQEEARGEKRRQGEAHDVQTASQTFGPDPTYETAETPHVKEEPEEERLKEEEEEQQDNDPEYSVAHVKTETRISSETTRQSEAFTHTDDEEDWREMDTEADVDHYNQALRATSSGLCPKYKSAVEIGGDVGSSSDTDDDDDDDDNDNDNDSEMTYPEMTENPEDLSGTVQGDDVRQFQSRFLAKEKAHHCPSCDKSFVYIAALIKHMKTHENGDEDAGKKHRCDMCDKRFSRRQQLQRHSRTHTGEKPYECPVCLKRVCTSQSLVIHMRTHTGEKPFSCLVCGKRFIDNSTLLTHTTIHTGERPYPCTLCQKGFVKPSRLEAHMRKNH